MKDQVLPTAYPKDFQKKNSNKKTYIPPNVYPLTDSWDNNIRILWQICNHYQGSQIIRSDTSGKSNEKFMIFGLVFVY